MGAKRSNKNAAGKRQPRTRIRLDLSVSRGNGLLELASQYLARQGTPDTDENIKALASDFFYLQFGQWLKREIESEDAAIVL